MMRNHAALKRLLLALLGIALLVFLIARIGPSAIAAQLSQAGPGILWLFFPYAVGTIIGAFPWAFWLDPSERPTLNALIWSRFAASGANAILPLFGVAGEPSRLLWLEPRVRADGLAALILDRIVYNCASALFLTSGAVVAWALTPLAGEVAAGALALSVVVFAVTCAIGWGAARFGVGRRFERIARRIVARSDTPGDFGSRVDRHFRALLQRPAKDFLRAGVVHFIGRAALGAEIYVALAVMGAPVTLATAFVLATVPVATAAVGSAIPSQLGVQEGGQALVCAALGLDPAIGVSLVLLTRVRQLAFVPLTPVLLTTARGTVVA